MTPATMKAAVLTGFGGPEVIQIAQRPVPVLKANQMLIQNQAASVNSGDARIRSKTVPKGYEFIMSLVFGFNRPRTEILGTVFAGKVTQVGASVTKFNPGDLVFGSTELKMATHSEFVAIGEAAAITHCPDELTPAEAASLVFGGTTALYFIEKSDLKRGERILVNAAAGSVGIAVVQIASQMGAHVTAIASSANHDFLRENGAKSCIDYTVTNLENLTDKFDVIVDCLGTIPYAKHHHLLNKQGRFALVTGTLAEGLAAPFRSVFGMHKIVSGTSFATRASLEKIVKLATSGAIKPIIDATFTLDQIQDAHARIDKGHKRGNFIVKFRPRPK
ncbi:MAG: NAD(P)-dependent alcohol dehydrogenase [Marinovum sp.]|nr:NAD(P)-dependent alcohol dehydrogenase [Marinovum sp.]MBT7907889.1 NAD(P)-dependent alcohol dehydrogenase [Marinovum sp.]